MRLGIRRTTARDDYLPRSVSEDAIPPRDLAQEYLPPDGATPPADYEIRSGDLKIENLARTSSSVRFTADSLDGGIVALNLHDFPGWEITIAGPPDGHAEPLAPGTDRAGRMVLSIPPGRLRVAVRWTETPLRRRCDLASAGAALIALLLVALPAARRRGRRAA